MFFRRFTAFIAAIMIALGLGACANTPSAPPASEQVVNQEAASTRHLGSVVNMEFESGVKCSVFDTVNAGGVSCDFRALDDADLGTIGQEYYSTSLGSVELMQTGSDRVCVTFDGTKSGAIDCYFK